MLLELPLKLSSPPNNPYDVHDMVYSTMLRPGTDDERDFIFAVLPDMNGMVLIRSARFPEHLMSHAIPVRPPVDGQMRDFTLIASPMKNVVGGNGKKVRKALPQNDPGARIEWLSRMGRTHGFSLKEVSVTSRTVHYVKDSGRFWLERAEYQGELLVTDADKLKSALANGIGRARSLGYGLMRLL